MNINDMTETIGIISSFDILCGNATYAEQLAQGLENLGHKVIRIAVPETIQKEKDNKAIDEIIRQAKQCTIINLQMEIGLYGSNPSASSKNLKKILNSISVPTTVTVHRIEKKPQSYLRMIKSRVSKMSFMSSVTSVSKLFIKQSYLYLSYRRIFNQLHKEQFTIISHTNRDKKFLKKYYNLDSFCHPIFWPKSLVTETSTERDHSGIEVGIFGFISPHKNFKLVVEAFSYLLRFKLIPDDSRLVIYGGHHPEAPGYGGDFDPFLLHKKKIVRFDITRLGATETINYLIQKNQLRNVDWVVGASDNEMATAISQVDICVIPYLETGQSGSGITSQSIQFAKKFVMSDTKMARQHQELCNKRIILFDTSSAVSLASAILRALETDETPRFKDEFSYERLLNIMLAKSNNDSN